MNIESKTENKHSTLTRGLVVMSIVFVITLLVVMGLTIGLGGSQLILPVLSAFVAGYLGALIAHIAGEYPRGDFYIMTRLLLSTMVRLALPLGFLVVLKMNESPWMDSGIVYFVLLFYVVGLATDLSIHVKRFQSMTATEKTIEPNLKESHN